MDRARVQIGRISKFGLLEMSQQRLRPSLGESSQIVCPRCTGQGTIRGVESLSLSVLRLIEEEVMKDNTQRVIARVPVDVGTYLLNEKRELLVELESRHKIPVMLIPTPALDTPNYDIQRIRKDDSIEDKPSPSYHIANEPIESEEVPQDFVWLLKYLFTEVLDGRNAYLTDGVKQALGREPRSFHSYAAATAETGVWN